MAQWNSFWLFLLSQTLVVSTIAEECLSLVKKYNLTEHISVTDAATVVDYMIKQKKLDPALRNRIVLSQFRSYDYMPRLAKWFFDKEKIPHEQLSMSDIPEAPKAVWWVDNFGNCKTTVLPEEINHKAGKIIIMTVGKVVYYDHLKDVPNGEAGLIIGSSGLRDKRFIELVVQGKSAAEHFSIKPGDQIF